MPISKKLSCKPTGTNHKYEQLEKANKQWYYYFHIVLDRFLFSFFHLSYHILMELDSCNKQPAIWCKFVLPQSTSILLSCSQKDWKIFWLFSLAFLLLSERFSLIYPPDFLFRLLSNWKILSNYYNFYYITTLYSIEFTYKIEGNCNLINSNNYKTWHITSHMIT